jgi:hypothetical protein
MSAKAIVAFAILLAYPAIAHAEYIVYEFEGVFEHDTFAGPVVPNGSYFRGLFSFSEFGNREDEDFNGGVRSYYSPMYIELSVGEDTIWTNDGEAQVRNAVTLFDDLFLVRAVSEANTPFSGPLNGKAIRFFSLSLDGLRDTLETSDYPRSLHISDFQTGRIGLLAGPLGSEALSSNSFYGISGDQTFDEFTVSEVRICETRTCRVPEPSGPLLVLSGIALVGATRFRRHPQMEVRTVWRRANGTLFVDNS